MHVKKVILYFLFFSYALAGFAEETKPYDLFISLGSTCEAAFQLEWLKLRKAAFPFDWCITPFDGLCNFIANDAANFLERGNLKRHPKWIEDTAYQMLFLHDFDLKHKNPMYNYVQIKNKYNRRIQRFFDALNSNQKILFIRVQITFEQAVHLDELLHSRYPNLNYTILAIDETDEISAPWGLERVINVYHKNLADWPSALPEWRQIFFEKCFK